jgi:hypothetical protein
MRIVFGGILVVVGAMLMGLAYHNKISDAWKEVQASS